MGKKLSRAIRVGRGVRQGDPMSPVLFNAMIDMVVSDIDRSIGVTGGEKSAVKCNYIAFADDLLLLSSTDVGIKGMLQQLEISMAKVGLTMNPAKCALMRTEVITRKRRWIVNPEPYLKLQDEDIRALSIVNTYKYLGVQIGPRMQLAKRPSLDFAGSSRAMPESIYLKDPSAPQSRSFPHLRNNQSQAVKFC